MKPKMPVIDYNKIGWRSDTLRPEENYKGVKWA
jgi:hypothetical protein